MSENAIKIIGVILAMIALIGTVVGAYKLIDSKGYARGQAETNAVWQAREAKELAAANAMILMESDKARKAERAAQIAVTNANETRRKADAEAKARVPVVAGAVSGGLASLCNGGTTPSQGAGNDPAGATAEAGSRNDGASRGEFFEIIGRFLSSEADRADQVARKLTQAQNFIRTALETCQ